MLSHASIMCVMLALVNLVTNLTYRVKFRCNRFWFVGVISENRYCMTTIFAEA